MIQLVILFLFVVFVIAVILLYKKYIKIKNIVDEEQDKKYNKVKEAVDSNNEKIKDMKKDVKDILNDEGNNVSSLESRVNANKEQIASNRNTIIDNNFETINSVFKYDNGLVIGGTAGHMRMGDDNIRLNVQNPTQARVCDSNKNCTNIITKKMVEDTWPTQISSGPGVSTTTTSPVDGGGGGNGGGGNGSPSCSDSTAGILTITPSGVVKLSDSFIGFQVTNMNITYSDELDRLKQNGEISLSPFNTPLDNNELDTHIGYSNDSTALNLSELFTINAISDVPEVTSQILVQDKDLNQCWFDVTMEAGCYILNSASNTATACAV